MLVDDQDDNVIFEQINDDEFIVISRSSLLLAIKLCPLVHLLML